MLQARHAILVETRERHGHRHHPAAQDFADQASSGSPLDHRRAHHHGPPLTQLHRDGFVTGGHLADALHRVVGMEHDRFEAALRKPLDRHPAGVVGDLQQDIGDRLRALPEEEHVLEGDRTEHALHRR